MHVILRTCLFMTTVFFISSCKKNSIPSTSSSTHLVDQVITEFPLYSKRDTIQYHYNSNNNLTDYGPIIKGKYKIEYKFFYNTENRATEVDLYDFTNDTLTAKSIFIYHKGYYTLDDTLNKTITSHFIYTLNDSQQVIKYENQKYYVLLNYDLKGNMIHSKAYAQLGYATVNDETTLKYDSYKNPFYTLKGNYGFMFLTPHVNTCINNPTNSTNYEYDSSGYLIKSTETSYINNNPVTYYKYTIK